ncbi:MAG: T9SS type A sorting domain-containing protein [Bacteroidetes bacterium]|nr:T9SS type A sorting domain-containing protein [Bacteroidota bacterium]
MKKFSLILVLLTGVASFTYSQWSRTSSYYAGDVYGLSSSPGAVGMLTNTGVSIFTTSGLTWNAMKTFPSLSSSAVIAGNDKFMVINDYSYHITRDGGVTWTEQSGPSAGRFLGLMGQVIVAINSSNILSYSTDYGVTWNESPGGLTTGGWGIYPAIMDNEVYAFQFTDNGDILYKCSFDGVSFSAWEVVNTYTYYDQHSSLISSNGILYTGSSNGIKRSVNKGLTWTLLGYSGGYQVYSMAADSAYLYANMGNDAPLARYSFATGTWKTLLAQWSSDTTAYAIATCNGHFFAYLSKWSTILGCYEYSGDKWRGVNALPVGNSAYGVSCIRSAGDVLFASVSSLFGWDVYTSSNDGKTWLLCNDVNSWSVKDAFHAGPNFLIAGYTGVGIVDTATNDILHTAGIPGDEAYSFGTYGNVLYAGTSDGIYSSADNGVSWVYKYLKGKKVYKLEVCMDTLYAGTDQGLFYEANGAAWGNTTCLVPDIIGIAATDKDIFVASAAGLLKKDYATNTCLPVGTALVGTDVSDIAARGKRLYVATRHGTVLYTANGGTTWMDISEAGFSDVTGLDFSGYDLFISESASGVWNSPVGWSAGIDAEKTKQALSLFPVPARDRLTIRIPDGMKDLIAIELINSSGMPVKTTSVSEVFNATVTIDVSDLPAGLYMARLRNTEKSVCSKFSKLK